MYHIRLLPFSAAENAHAWSGFLAVNRGQPTCRVLHIKGLMCHSPAGSRLAALTASAVPVLKHSQLYRRLNAGEAIASDFSGNVLVMPRRPMPLLKPAEDYSRAELCELIERLKGGDDTVAYELIVFTLAESKGMWHGRARAKICRYLKNHPPEAALQAKLVDSIARRLRLGAFSEQFRDQLRMAIRFSPEEMRLTAESVLAAEMDHVRRCAAWVLEFEAACTRNALR